MSEDDVHIDFKDPPSGRAVAGEDFADERAHLQQRVQELEAQQRAILETIADGVITLDDKGRICRVNHAVLDMFGHKPEALLNETIAILAADEHRLPIESYIENHLSPETISPFNDGRELIALKKNGSSFPVYLTITEIETAGPRRFHCIIRDMSAQKEAREKALTAENHLSWAIEALKDGFVIFNEKDELVLSNRHYRNLHQGFEELIVPGVTFSEILEASLEHQLFKGAIGKEDTYFKARYAQHRHPSGPIEQRLNDGLTVCIIEQKTRNGYTIGLTVDISDLKKKERDLEKNESQLRKTLDAAMDAVIVVDREGHFIEYNRGAETTFGYPRGEVIGKKMAELIIPKQHRAEHYKGMSLYINTREHTILGKRLELNALHADGTEFPIELSIQAAETPDGPIFVGFARDITEKKAADKALIEAKERAEMANQAQTNFLAMMSHEIRTPLNGILGILTMLEDETQDPEHHKLISTGQQSGQALLRIINDVLDFSKIEAGKIDLEPKEFSLGELVNSSVAIIRPRASEKNLTFRIDIDGDQDTLLWGDMDRIRQVLINLGNNAVKFTEEGFVTLRCHIEKEAERRSKLSFFVVDTGIGIPQDKMGELFQKFKTVDPTFQRKEGGTGLGLAISKQIITSMTGQIGVKANDLGGSTFWFQISLDHAETAPSRQDPAPVIDCAPVLKDENTPYHLLMAEDNSTNAMVARSMLEKAGYLVDVVVDGIEAVEAVKDNDYDLILMDIGMPRMDGTDATAQIRKLPSEKANIPIIALTAHVLKDKRMAKMLIGIDDYLAKPINKEEMLATIKNWVTGQKSHAKTRQSIAEQLLADETDPLHTDVPAQNPALQGEVPSPEPDVVPVEAPVLHGNGVDGNILAGDEDASLGTASIQLEEGQLEERQLEERQLEERQFEEGALDGPFQSVLVVDRDVLIQLGQDTDPSLLPMLVDDFIKNTQQRCEAISTALEKNQSLDLEQQAHALGSSAATFGAMRLKQTLRTLEAACVNGDHDMVNDLGPHVMPLAEATIQQIKHAADELQSA